MKTTMLALLAGFAFTAPAMAQDFTLWRQQQPQAPQFNSNNWQQFSPAYQMPQSVQQFSPGYIPPPPPPPQTCHFVSNVMYCR